MMYARFFRSVLVLCALLTVGIPRVLAQPSPRRVSGVVSQHDTHMPLPGVTITVGDAQAVTDVDGRFTLTARPAPVQLEATLDGFYTLTTPLDLTGQDSTNLELLLVPRSSFESSVDVVAVAPPTTAPSAVTVAPAEVLRTPGSLDNVFRTLQTLPGVSAADEFGSRMAVRGGAPDQNLTMMDGVEIHDPYRLFGLTSAFNPELIKNFELATGGFSVKYGDRLSSLLVVENREGTRAKTLGGSAALSVTDANVVLEGKLPGKADGSWLVSGRRTYYDLVAARITDQDFPQFADLQTKAAWTVAPGRQLSLFALRSRQDAALRIDETNAQGEFNDNTKNDLVSLKFDAALGGSGQSHTTVAYSNSESNFGVNAAFENKAQRSNVPDDSGVGTANVKFTRTLALEDVSLRQELSWARGNHVLETGGELHGLNTRLAYVISGDRNTSEANGSSQRGGSGLPDLLISTRDTLRGGLWALDRWQVMPTVSLEGGVRLDRSGVNRDLTLSPRVTSTWSFTPNTRLRAAVGRYAQSPGYEKLVQSDYVLDLSGSNASRLRSERAMQSALGLEHNVGGVTMKVEGYYKRESRLLIGELETAADRQARLATYDFPAALASSLPTDPIITTTPTNDGRGRAYGYDLFVSRTSAPPSARLRGWASYTWGRARRTAYGRTYAFEYDRRHAASIVASYRLSDHWEVATTTRLASGFPRTAPLGVRVVGKADAADVDRDGNLTELVPARDAAGNLVYGVNYGGVSNLNNARLPFFARADVRATWRPRGPRGRWEFYVEVINVTNRKNAGQLTAELAYNPASDRPSIVETRDASIPRLPTLGLRVRF